MKAIKSNLKFSDINVGNRVKIVSKMVDFYFFYGETGIVTKNTNKYLGVSVKFDKLRHFKDGTIQTSFNFNPENLELIGKGMTFLEKAQEIIDQYGYDTEAVHSELDKLMEDILLSYGHVELVNLIREQTRWYA